MKVNGIAWFGFWIFLSVFWLLEVKMYMAGHDTLLFIHKTDAEKKIRDKQSDV